MFGCWRNNACYTSIPMAGDDSTAAMQAIESLLRLVRDVARTSGTGFKGRYKKDCTDLSRRVAMLSHFVEEIRDFQATRACSSSLFRCSISQLTAALKAARTLLQSPKRETLDFTSHFEGVTCKLELALANFPYGDIEISEEVKEQVDFVRYQLKRATQRQLRGVKEQIDLVRRQGVKKSKVLKSSYSGEIPDDFLCPISLELMKDPVIVSTGQTYERSYIRMWIKSGKRSCPKTRLKLKNNDLIPNYVLRSLIAQWCKDHDVEQPILSKNKPMVDNPATATEFIQEQRPNNMTLDLMCMGFSSLLFLCFYFLILHHFKFI